jgi:CHAT domain-containing protein
VSRHGNRWGLVLCVCGVSLCLLAVQGQTQSTSSASPAGTSQSAATPNPGSGAASSAVKNSTPPQTAEKVPPDPGAQIDEVMKQCNEAMNVKVQFQRAEELARQALDLSEKAGDKARAANAMVYLGAALSYQGRQTEAAAVAQKGVSVARESGDKKVLAQALNTAAGVAEGLGRSEDALAYLYQALDAAHESGYQVMQYMALLNIGELYVHVGDPNQAEAPLLESLRLGREIKHTETIRDPSKKAVEMALAYLGEMEIARHRFEAALNYYEQVYASHPESPLWVITALQGMAEAQEQLGQHQKAIDLLREAMPLAEATSAGAPYAFILSDLGRSQESLGQLEDALASQNRALAVIHQGGGNADYEWQFESRIGHVERALGHDDEALEHYQEAIKGIERLRSVTLNTEGGRAGVLERSRATYAETADLLFDLHRPEQALEVAERGRARAFLEMLTEARVGVADELTPDQRKREDTILSHVSSLQKELWKQNLSAEERKRNEAEMTSAETDLEKFHLEVRQSNPHYASVRYPEPIDVREIQSKLLDNRTALIEFLLGDKRSLAWVITRDKVTTSILPGRKDIEERVAAYRQVLRERVSALTLEQSLTKINARGRELYDLIFKPIENDVAFRQTLIVVPDGTLGYLPFETLVTASGHGKNAYLAQKFAIVYGPSASALVTVEEMNRQFMLRKQLLAFGDPVVTVANGLQKTVSEPRSNESVSKLQRPSPTDDYEERGFSLARLPYTRDEVMGIGNLFPPDQRQLYLGADAREERVKSEKLDDFRYIHFATHGFLDELHPGRSGILLSRAPDSKEDGILQTGEIMRLKLNADIVTLSACSTGLGKLVTGEGVLGLTRAFFYAGARNVAVSLWNVNDSATATLMESFYLNLKRGLPKSEALRQAKLSLLHNSQITWQHPYFWAGFVLEGQGH